MTLAHLVAFNLALLVAVSSPGPAFLVAVRTTLGAGRSAGLAVGCGLALVAASWTLVALLGLQGVFLLFPWVYVAVKVLGGGYLVLVAVKTWRGARQPVDVSASRADRAFVRGILVNLLNPKAVLFAAAVLVAVFPAHMSMVNVAIVAVDHLAIEVAFYTVLAFCFSTRVVGSWYRGAQALRRPLGRCGARCARGARVLAPSA